MEQLLSLLVLALSWSASMGLCIWEIRKQDLRYRELQGQISSQQVVHQLRLDQQQAAHLNRERELLNRIMAKDPSEFLTLQAGTSITEWPQRKQLLTDKDEALWDKERRS